MGSEQRIAYGLWCDTALQNPLPQRVAEPGRGGGTGRAPRRPPACGTPTRVGDARAVRDWDCHRCWGGTRREAAGEDAEPAPSTPAHLGASGAFRVPSPARGKRLTLQGSELLFVFSAAFLSGQGICQDGRCRDRRGALTELWFRGQVE